MRAPHARACAEERRRAHVEVEALARVDEAE
jgi:hypothetical protein